MADRETEKQDEFNKETSDNLKDEEAAHMQDAGGFKRFANRLLNKVGVSGWDSARADSYAHQFVTEDVRGNSSTAFRPDSKQRQIWNDWVKDETSKRRDDALPQEILDKAYDEIIAPAIDHKQNETYHQKYMVYANEAIDKLLLHRKPAEKIEDEYWDQCFAESGVNKDEVARRAYSRSGLLVALGRALDKEHQQAAAVSSSGTEYAQHNPSAANRNQH